MTHLDRKGLTLVGAASAVADTSQSLSAIVAESQNETAKLILSPRALELAALYEQITSEEVKSKVFDVVFHISAS